MPQGKSDQASRQKNNISISIITSLNDIDATSWDECLGTEGSPFLRYSFLYGLESCQCVGEKQGWIPRYIVAETDLNQEQDKLDQSARQKMVVGVTPAYIKSHSQGEFIFDWSWADAAHRAGMPYYPKLVVTSPFSPIGSKKLLVRSDLDLTLQEEVRKTLVFALRQLTLDEPMTGLHLLFTSPIEMPTLEDLGLLTRHTLQFHWENDDYQDFTDFLSRFKSKKRNQIKRERRRVKAAGVDIKAYWGETIEPQFIPLIYKFYRSTVEKYFFGNLYLNEKFFEYLYHHQRENICLLLAWQHGQIIGGSFNLLHQQVLYGRYWGIDPEVKVDYLHFEVCAYKGIELCIEQGWKRFEAGAGGGSHKYGRGFLPKIIYSAHEVYLPGFKSALTQLLEQENLDLKRQLSEAEDDVLKPRRYTKHEDT